MVSEAATADVQAATAAEDVQAPPQEAPAPETEEQTAPETEPAAPPAPPEPQPPSPEDLQRYIDDLPDEDFERLGRVARHGESQRRRAESEAQRRAQERDREWMARDGYVNDLANVVGTDDDGNVTYDRDGAGTIADRMWQTTVRAGVGTLARLIDNRLPEGFTLTAAEERQMREAFDSFAANIEDGEQVLEAYLNRFERAAVDRAKPDLRKEIEAEVRADLESRARSEELKQADERGRTQQPTRVEGGPGTQWSTQQAIDTAHVAGQISTEQYRQLMVDGTYYGLPAS